MNDKIKTWLYIMSTIIVIGVVGYLAINLLIFLIPVIFVLFIIFKIKGYIDTKKKAVIQQLITRLNINHLMIIR